MFSSCEHQVEMKTIVHEDGSLDKTIILYSKDLKLDTKNYLNVGTKQGWNVSIDSVQKRDSTKKASSKNETKFVYSFRKSFASANASNDELATSSDSLFRVSSKFEKKFRWFYSSYYYADTYHAINRFKLSIDDYLTSADFQFIEKLPAEGKAISKADSLFLNKLNERIFDHYGNRAYFDESFQVLLDLADATQKQKLMAHRESIFELLFKKDSKLDDDPWPALLDSLKIAINTTSVDYKTKKALVESKLNFMSWASEGKYRHTIVMPGEMVEHNADSVSGNEFYWTPSYLKFAFKDYTLSVETKRPNIWAWVVSILIMVAAAWGLRRKNRL